MFPLGFILFALFSSAAADFGFFEQMFGGGGGGGGPSHDHSHTQQRMNPSDASLYHSAYGGSSCDKYLCPDTLACVHFPHHCPCAWDANDDKFELADGKRICISKGGFKPGEAARKVELARKGLL
ncbi:Long chronological lifespan protein 2 [Ophiocordyceps camponoti-floridani]|uniref:Long chronological lifespan protein 2 n=1 Tax=Ophiocordyceps camponoti-floridani TaxID=2030778 RepID=A0A8H4Q8D9_9HYPO|nr:Long chronological lifespan protein 2 [Ophiocordyceps camponoti-floridani]